MVNIGINVTEGRAVLHTALRQPRGAVVQVDGQDVVPDVHEVLDRVFTFAREVRSGEWRGFTGQRIRNVVNIGINVTEGRAVLHTALRQPRGAVVQVDGQ
ncbi:hypothetical protein CTI14_60375, partial [Methylobacterium radiotolerans]